MNIVQQDLVEIIVATALVGATVGTASAFKEEIKVECLNLYMYCRQNLKNKLTWLNKPLPQPTHINHPASLFDNLATPQINSQKLQTPIFPNLQFDFPQPQQMHQTDMSHINHTPDFMHQQHQQQQQ